MASRLVGKASSLAYLTVFALSMIFVLRHSYLVSEVISRVPFDLTRIRPGEDLSVKRFVINPNEEVEVELEFLRTFHDPSVRKFEFTLMVEDVEGLSHYVRRVVLCAPGQLVSFNVTLCCLERKPSKIGVEVWAEGLTVARFVKEYIINA